MRHYRGQAPLWVGYRPSESPQIEGFATSSGRLVHTDCDFPSRYQWRFPTSLSVGRSWSSCSGDRSARSWVRLSCGVELTGSDHDASAGVQEVGQRAGDEGGCLENENECANTGEDLGGHEGNDRRQCPFGASGDRAVPNTPDRRTDPGNSAECAG